MSERKQFSIIGNTCINVGKLQDEFLQQGEISITEFNKVFPTDSPNHGDPCPTDCHCPNDCGCYTKY